MRHGEGRNVKVIGEIQCHISLIGQAVICKDALNCKGTKAETEVPFRGKKEKKGRIFLQKNMQ